MRLLFALACLVCSLQLASESVDAQEWTRFRGPNGTGVSEAATIPVKWTEADYNWKVELPGLGHSAPAIWGDKVFLLSADPDTATRYMLCYSTTDGKQLWNREFKSGQIKRVRTH